MTDGTGLTDDTTPRQPGPGTVRPVLSSGPVARVAPERAQLLDRWGEAIARFADADEGRSVVVRGGDLAAGRGGDVVRPGASVLKLFVSIAVHAAAASGDVDLDEAVLVRHLPRSRYPSVLDSLAPEHALSVRELAGLALATSDNRIAQHLVDRLGAERIEAVAVSLGCTSTRLRSGFDDASLDTNARANLTTADDCARALAALQGDRRLQPLAVSLRSSLFNSRILSRLPDDVVVSHKTGSLTGVVNDVGVIHARSGDLTVCFLADGQADAACTSVDIGACTRAVFDAWEERQR